MISLPPLSWNLLKSGAGRSTATMASLSAGRSLTGSKASMSKPGVRCIAATITSTMTPDAVPSRNGTGPVAQSWKSPFSSAPG